MSGSAARAAATVGLLLLAAGLTACGGNGTGNGGPDDDTVLEDAPRAHGPGADARRADAPAANGGRAVCLQGEPFTARGTIPVAGSGPTTAGSRQVAGIRWERHDGCERVVVDVTGPDGGEVAVAGTVDAELLRDRGVVRLHLRDAETVATDATDARFDGPLAAAAYAVWAPDGREVYVDVHLDRPAEAHVLLLRDPARVVADLRPGGPALPGTPVRGNRVVVLDPRPGDAAYPLTVTGYARTFEANVVARIEQAGETVRDTFTTATAWADAWGHYSVTFPDGPTGSVRLHVGEHSARDGTWEGVAVELEVR